MLHVYSLVYGLILWVNPPVQSPDFVHPGKDKPALRRVIRYILQDSTIRYKSLTIAQLRHESGNGSSRLFKQDKNCFGIVYTKSGLADYRVPPRRVYAGYYTYKRSVEDFSRLQNKVIRKYHLTTKAKYIHWLHTRYSHDSEYVKKISQHLY